MLKILIAEDEPMIADMAEEILAEHGYQVCGIARTVKATSARTMRCPPRSSVAGVVGS